MIETNMVGRAEDQLSVGSRVSWAAVFAGAILALAIYFLLMLLGNAVGLTIGERVDAANVQTGAIAWSLLTLCTAVFVGGVITSLFTVGENKVEAVIYGVLMWAVLIGLLIFLGGMGFRAGFHALTDIGRLSGKAATANSESVTRDGVLAKASETAKTAATPISREDMEKAATQISWIAFFGTWVSMMAAAAGAWMGAGPTFRVVVVRSSQPFTAP